MSIVVGYDRSAFSTTALHHALESAAAEAVDTVYVVHVVSQAELDATKELTADAKKAAALESLYPALWKEITAVVEAVAEREPLVAAVTIDLELRFAPVHLTRLQSHIAAELLQVASDYGAAAIVLGRAGRPGSVAELLLSSDQFDAVETSRPLVLTAKAGRAHAGPARAWRGSPS